MKDKVQYKDIKLIKKELFKLVDDMPKEYCNAIDDCINIIDNVPIADVVPKSEVEKAIDDLKRYIILNEDISKKCKSENGEQNEEYWKGKLSALLQIRGYLDSELKKKYTEGEQDVQT